MFHKCIMLIFSLLFLLEILPSINAVTPTSPAEPSYFLGVFKETFGPREFGIPAMLDPGVPDREACRQHCGALEFKFTALAGNPLGNSSCFCGRNHSSQPALSAQPMFTACAAQSNDCHKYIRVYWSVVPIYRRDVSLTTTSGSSVFTVGDTVNFTIAANEGENLLYQMDYGDGLPLTRANGTGMLSHNFHRQGDYLVTLHARDENDLLEVEKVSLLIRIVGPIGEISADLNKTYFVNDQVNVTIYVPFASSSVLSVDWGDGHSTKPFSLADTRMIITNERYARDYGVPSTSTGAYIMPGAEFTERGVLQSFEYLAVQGGTITIWILKPSCSDGYCFSSNHCTQADSSAACGKCGGSDGNKFCMQTESCVRLGNTLCTRKGRYQNNSLGLLYQIVSTHTVTLAAIGRGSVNVLEQNVMVQPGYIVGYKPGTGLLAVYNISNDDVSDFLHPSYSAQQSFDPNTLTPVTGRRHALNGIAVPSMKTAVYHTYKNPGNYTMNVTITNTALNISKSIDQLVRVFLPLNCTILQGICAASNETYTLKAVDNDDASARYTWDFGDESQLVTTNIPEVNHTYTTPGFFNASLLVENPIESKWNQSVVCIQDGLSNVSLYAPSLVNTSQEQYILFIMEAGYGYTCIWDMGDGSNYTTNEENVPSGKSLSHTFQFAGDFTVAVTCSNTVNTVSNATVVRVREAIINLRLEPFGALVGQPFQVHFAMDNGTDPQIKLLFDGIVYPYKYYPENKTGHTVHVFPKMSGGLHDVAIFAMNDISSVNLSAKFFIEPERIFDKYLVPLDSRDGLETLLITGESARFMVDLRGGSSVRVDFDFKDGSSKTPYYVGDLIIWPFAWNVSHAFNKEGFYNISVTFSNSLGVEPVLWHVVRVFNKVNGSFSLNVKSPAPLNFFASCSMAFIQPPGVDPPTNASVLFSYGDKTTTSLQNFAINRTYHYDYSSSTSYLVTANVSNPVSWKVLQAEVDVRQVISCLMVHVNAYVPVGRNVSIGVSILTGDGANMTVNVGNGDLVRNWVQEKSGTIQYFEHIFHPNTIVNYSIITVIAANAIGVTKLKWRVRGQYPVNRHFTWTTTDSSTFKRFTAGGINQSFTLRYPNIQLPTNASCFIVWGDGSNDTHNFSSIEFIGSKNHQYDFMHHFTMSGYFSVNIIVYNLASNESFSFLFGVLEPIVSLSAYAMYKPDFPLDSPELTGFNSSANVFPYSEPVKLYMRPNGTVKEYHLEFSENGTSDSVRFYKQPASLRFPGIGNFTVNITAVNDISSESVILLLTLFEPANTSSLSHSANGNVGPGDVKKIKVYLNLTETKNCMNVSYGDGTWEVYGFSQEGCFINIPTNTYLRRRLLASWESTIKAPVTSVMNLQHVYHLPGHYKIVITVYNSKGQASPIVLPVPISVVSCDIPEILITDQSKVFYRPRPVYRKDPVHIITDMNIDCLVTNRNRKSWTVEKVDPQTGKVIEKIDTGTKVVTTQAELYIEPRLLQYGLYKLTYTVIMDVKDTSVTPPVEPFQNSEFTYVQVIESVLRPSLTEGVELSLQVRYGDPVTLDPVKWSRDPDELPTNNQGFTEFEIFCRNIKNKFTYNQQGTLSKAKKFEPYSEYELNVIPFTSTSCLKQGPGMILTPQILMKPLTFSSRNLAANEAYEFFVVGKKGSRIGNGTFQIDVVTYNPPKFTIRCVAESVCSRSKDGININRDAVIGLEVLCISDCDQPMKYSWELEVLGLNGQWVKELRIEKFAEGLTGKAISISQKLFAYYADVTKIRVIFRTVTTVSGTLSTNTVVPLLINDAPRGGTCSLTPSNGKEFHTYFAISCDGFADSNGIAKYTFYAKTSAEASPQIIQSGTSRKAATQFPRGTHDIFVDIEDSLGATNVHKIGSVKVTDLTLIEKNARVKAILPDMPTNKTIIHLRASVGNTAKISNLCNEFARHLNDIYQAEEKGIIEMKTTSNFVKYATRDERAVFRDSIAAALVKSQKNTLNSMLTVSKTMSLLLKEPGGISIKSQELIGGSVLAMANHLNKISSRSHLRIVTFAAVNLIELIGLMLKDVSFPSNKKPLLTDISDAKKSELFFYDTDLNSPRKAFFGTASDVTEQLAAETSGLLQKRMATGVTPQLLSALEIINKAYGIHLVPGQAPFSVNTHAIMNWFSKKPTSALKGVTRVSDVKVDLPGWTTLCNNSSCNSSDSTEMLVAATNFPTHTYAANSGAVSRYTAAVVLDLFTANGKVSVTLAREEILLDIPRIGTRVPNFTEFNNGTMLAQQNLLYHSFTIHRLDVSLHVEIFPKQKGIRFLVVLAFGRYPNLTTKDWDHITVLPSNMIPGKHPRYVNVTLPNLLFLNNVNISCIGKIGKVIIGLRQLDKYEPNYSDINPPPLPKPHTGDITVPYRFRAYTSGCYFYSPASNTWKNNGCRVGRLTTPLSTQCFCNHLTSFGSGMVVAPNTIDWDFVFANMDFAKNPTLYATVITITVVYILMAVWARRKDLKDVEKLGVTALKDNSPEDRYLYLINVFTGSGIDSGTESNVHFTLFGDYDNTDVRTFSDDRRNIFKRGAKDNFLLAVPWPLGDLNFIHIWHDNSGEGARASWYLKNLLVTDLQTRQKYHFICNQWFAVEKGDGVVERKLTVAGMDDRTQVKHLFNETVTRNIGDGHLWFSIFGRPATSRFTRLQRLSCCLCLLYTSMLANVMFYEQGNGNADALIIGPFAISSQQIFIGIVSNAIVFPINFIILTLFRKSRPRKTKAAHAQEVIDEHYAKSENDSTSGGSSSLQKPWKPSQISRKTKKPFTFPWWGLLIAWILLWSAVLVSGAFVLFYGIMFQDEKVKKWITSMVVTFFTSAIITEPIKVVLLAFFISLIVRKPVEDEEDVDHDQQDLHLHDDEEWLHYNPADYPPRTSRLTGIFPPDAATLAEARSARLEDLKVNAILRELLFYGTFLLLLFYCSYTITHPNSFQMKQSVSSVVIQEDNFLSIRTIDSYWSWVESDLLPGIRAPDWYNGMPPFNQRGFLSDRAGRMMGYAVVRQLRVKPGKCSVHSMVKGVISECNIPYSATSDDTDMYDPWWKPHVAPLLTTDDIVSNSSCRNENRKQVENGKGDTRPEYQYTDSSELEGYPYIGQHATYSGGGYVWRLSGNSKSLKANMLRLKSEAWIDRYTRAIFVEFTVYNPNVNLFGIVTLLLEQLHSGGMFASFRVEPVNLLGKLTTTKYIDFACYGVYMLFILFFLIKEIRCMIRERKAYFKQFWNWIEIAIIIMSFCVVGIYFYRLILANALISRFNKSRGMEYMKFQYIGQWNESLLYMVAWLAFFATMKLLHLLRFNKKIGFMAATVRRAAGSLLLFSIMFAVTFFAFVQFFYMIYSVHLLDFSSFITSVETSMNMFLGQFDFVAMQNSSRYLGIIMFFVYILTVAWILVGMFITILDDAFSRVRQNAEDLKNDCEMIDVITERFKRMIQEHIHGNPKPPPAKMMNKAEEDDSVVYTLQQKVDPNV